MLLDPLLSRYSVVMIDDVHERSVSTDMLLGVLKKILLKRKEFRVVISSATMDQSLALFYDEFSHVVLEVPGRNYPVEIHYLEEPCGNYIEEAVSTVFKIHNTSPGGDILVFLANLDDLEAAFALLHESADREHDWKKRDKINLLPMMLHGDMDLVCFFLVFRRIKERFAMKLTEVIEKLYWRQT